MKAFSFILLSICSIFTFAQTSNKHSIGADINYLIPMMEGTNNNFNYSASLMFSEKVLPRIKVSAGVNYSSLSYYVPTEESFGIRYKKSSQTEMQCLNIPLLISFIRDSEKKFKIEPLVGVIASKIVHHGLTYYNADVPQYIEEGLPDQLMWSLRAGINVAHPISKHFIMNFAPTIDLKIIGNKNVARYGGSYSYSNSDLPDAILGFKLGLEYGW